MPSDRSISLAARAVGAGLQVAWIRRLLLPELRYHFQTSGRSWAGFARAIGTTPRTVAGWLQHDPELRAYLSDGAGKKDSKSS